MGRVYQPRVAGAGKGDCPLVAGFLLFFLAAFSAYANDDLTQVEAAFLRGEYASVVARSQALLEQDSSPKDDLLYLQGMSALKLRDFSAARTSLERLIKEYPRSRWVSFAWMGIGQSWEWEGKSEAALKVYADLLKNGSAKEIPAQVSLRAARVRQQMGLWEPAREGLEHLVRDYPNTAEAEDARSVLQSGDFYFCVQVGAFATKSNAARLVAELHRLGFKAELSQAALNGGLFHRVRVGRFAKREEAQKEAQRLQGDGFPAKVFP